MNQQPSGFRDLLNKMMSRRWYITAMVLGGFILIIGGIFTAISLQTPMAGNTPALSNVPKPLGFLFTISYKESAERANES